MVALSKAVMSVGDTVMLWVVPMVAGSDVVSAPAASVVDNAIDNERIEVKAAVRMVCSFRRTRGVMGPVSSELCLRFAVKKALPC